MKRLLYFSLIACISSSMTAGSHKNKGRAKKPGTLVKIEGITKKGNRQANWILQTLLNNAAVIANAAKETANRSLEALQSAIDQLPEPTSPVRPQTPSSPSTPEHQILRNPTMPQTPQKTNGYHRRTMINPDVVKRNLFNSAKMSTSVPN